MKQEDYVSYEVAKLLKEKGYDKHSIISYFTKDENAFNYKEGDMCIGSHTVDGECITIYAPTLWDAQKWLREEYKISVEPIFIFCDDSWDCSICKMTKGELEGYLDKEFKTYEVALNEGIKEALKMI